MEQKIQNTFSTQHSCCSPAAHFVAYANCCALLTKLDGLEGVEGHGEGKGQ